VRKTGSASKPSPIQKYNYERSTYRWLMARHTDEFASRGITSKTLESASRARQAFHRSGWMGACSLIRVDNAGRYERTSLFETLIKRGLNHGTKFDIKTLTCEEQKNIGIGFDPNSNKYTIVQFMNFPVEDESTPPVNYSLDEPIIEKISPSSDNSSTFPKDLPKFKVAVTGGRKRKNSAEQINGPITKARNNSSAVNFGLDAPLNVIKNHVARLIADDIDETTICRISRIKKGSNKVHLVLELESQTGQSKESNLPEQKTSHSLDDFPVSQRPRIITTISGAHNNNSHHHHSKSIRTENPTSAESNFSTCDFDNVGFLPWENNESNESFFNSLELGINYLDANLF